jgi:hypothetical protein
MWGYALCGTGTTAPAGCPGTVGIPGPALAVPPGESLTVHLQNDLPAPTSLVINGQTSAMAPVWIEPATVKGAPNPNAGTVYAGARPPGNLTAVVRSFTAEAAPGASATYTWPTVKPGTYLYQSGTQPQVQVQMGLYGPMTQDTDVGNVAYRQGAATVAYNQQFTLLYSEVDPVLHEAVATGTFGTSGPTSTLDYQPKYFLINGKPYDTATNPGPVATVPAAQATLVRFINAGLKMHVPTISGQYWRVIAEDGNPYPYLNNPRQQYTVFLPPGKTADVLLVPVNPNASASVRHAIYDSRMFDTNNGAQGGGLLALLDVTPATAAAPVFDSSPVTMATANVPYSYQAHATDPNGDVVSYSLNAGFPAGMSIGGTGLVTWTPTAAGSYPVSIRASDGTLFSDQNYAITVASGAPANNPPTARNDVYTAIAHPTSSGLVQVVAAPGVLANDSDPDAGNTLTAVNKTGSSRVTLSPSGSFTLAPAGGGSGTTGTVSFTYQAQDNSGAGNNTSLAATGTINVIANRRPTTVADAFSVPRCTVRVSTTTQCRTTGSGAYVPVTLNLGSNDTDPDTSTIDVDNQLPLSVARLRSGGGGNGITSGTLITSSGGRVTFSGSLATGVKVTYTPIYNFSGTDTFQYKVQDRLGLTAGNTNAQGWATVTVSVQ